MSQPIVFISRNRIVGDRPRFAAAFGEVVSLIESTKPRTALSAAYIDERDGEVRVVHVFPDPSALAAHFEGSDARSAAVANVISPAGFEIYGSAPAAATQQLRHEADAAGVPFESFPGSLGGFIRAPR